MKLLTSSVLFEATVCLREMRGKKLTFTGSNCPRGAAFRTFFWVLKIKNSHIASYQNFICQSPMIISEVLSISLDQQIVYQNDMNKTWLYTHIMSRTVFM